MNQLLNTFMDNLRIGEDQILGRLTIKPIINVEPDHARPMPLKTMDEAISQDLLEITEINSGGSVPQLLVKNLGDQDILILEGETVIGGKQNRAVNSTFIIPAGGEIVAPVSCVEAGRWRYASDNFSSGGSVVYPSLRAESHKAVSRNLHANQEYRSDQSGIWSDIASKGRRMEVASPTGAMADIERSAFTPEAESDLFEAIRCQENQVGFLAFIGGGFAGGDFFGSSELFEKQYRKILKGYHLDALDSGVRFPELSADEIIAEIAGSDEVRFAALGSGEENRFETAKLTGAWKSLDGRFANLTVFPRAGRER